MHFLFLALCLMSCLPHIEDIGSVLYVFYADMKSLFPDSSDGPGPFHRVGE
jgi:hypothetical protein